MKRTATITGLAVLAVALLVAAWFGYWALSRENTTQRYKVNTHNQQYQAGLISQQRDRIAAYDQATDPAQRAQLAATFCQIHPTLNPAPADLDMAAARICN